MKISKYKGTKSENYAKDPNTEFINLINDLSDQFGQVYAEKIEDDLFIYRTITRKEYKELLDRVKDGLEQENIICESCVVYPEDYDFDDCAAGIPTILAKKILHNSCLDSIETISSIIQYYRVEMISNFDNQINCIISEAFPNLSMEEIENFDMQKAAKYIADAEYKLAVIRNVPLDVGKLIISMKENWNAQHPDQAVPVDYDPNMQVYAVAQSKADEQTKASVEQTTMQSPAAQQPIKEQRQTQAEKPIVNREEGSLSDTDNKPLTKRKFIKKETLEERQKRVIKEGPIHYTEQERYEAMRKNPQIDWADEDFEHRVSEAEYQVGIETDPVALRTPRQD